MPTYVVLATMTQQGIQNTQGDTRSAGRDQRDGRRVGDHLARRLAHDGAVRRRPGLDKPDDQAVAKFALQIGMRGNLSTQTLPSRVNEEESDALLASL